MEKEKAKASEKERRKAPEDHGIRRRESQIKKKGKSSVYAKRRVLR